MAQPLIFISYSRKDEEKKEKLLSHLGVLQSAGLTQVWSDDRIGAGADWAQEIDAAMTQARVAILLVTADFLTSDFILNRQVPTLLKRRKEEGLIVFPVIASACAWRMVDWLSEMWIRPESLRPVWSDGGSHVDEDLTAIAEEVGRVIKQEGQPAEPPAEPSAAIQTLTDRDWDSLLYRIKAGKCTPFVGPELTQKIVRPDQELAQKWASEHAYPLNDPHNMPRVAQYLAIKLDPAFPADQVVRHLEELQTRPNFADPEEPHSFLASLPLPLYLTTNYDNFMVQALRHHNRNAHRELCRWSRYLRDLPSVFDSGSGVTIDATNPVVYHLFGHTGLPESMILTEDNYLDFLVNISRDQSVIPRQVEKALVGNSLLFVGYRWRDFRFRILFRGLVTALERSLRRTSIAVQLDPEPPDAAGVSLADVREYLEEYLAKDDVRIYWGQSTEFIRELKERWEAFNG